MSKYIPKVGEEFEWRSDGFEIWNRAGECLAHSTRSVGYEGPNGWLNTINKECEFRPIPTKAAVEREQLRKCLDVYSIDTAIDNVQKAGFTIPKKVKRSDISKLLHKHFDQDDVSETLKHILINEFCELLGDLVEGD